MGAKRRLRLCHVRCAARGTLIVQALFCVFHHFQSALVSNGQRWASLHEGIMLFSAARSFTCCNAQRTIGGVAADVSIGLCPTTHGSPAPTKLSPGLCTGVRLPICAANVFFVAQFETLSAATGAGAGGNGRRSSRNESAEKIFNLNIFSGPQVCARPIHRTGKAPHLGSFCGSISDLFFLQSA